jgi:hypothetical protein
MDQVLASEIAAEKLVLLSPKTGKTPHISVCHLIAAFRPRLMTQLVTSASGLGGAKPRPAPTLVLLLILTWHRSGRCGFLDLDQLESPKQWREIDHFIRS